MNADTMDMMWSGAFIAVKVLGAVSLWCIAAGCINKGAGG